MSLKKILNVFTVFLVLLILVLARNDLLEAWHLLWRVNIWIFLLIIPVQFFSYYAHGAMVFSYLKQRNDLEHVSWWEQPKMALELNFVNHVFPTAGVSGASYMTFRLNKLGVSTGRATLTQVVRFAMTYLSYTVLLLPAVIAITIDGGLTRMTILAACSLVGVVLFGAVMVVYLLGSQKRLEKFEDILDKFLNKRVRKWLKRKKPLVKREVIKQFFGELHDDYMTLRRSPKCLVKPFLWATAFNIAEVSLFFVTFLALGSFVNPAPILIAVGLASVVGAFLVTPGGAGGYEAVMVLFLSSVGVLPGIALAGVLLARTSLIVLTIATGYVFYNSAMKKYGSNATKR